MYLSCYVRKSDDFDLNPVLNDHALYVAFLHCRSILRSMERGGFPADYCHDLQHFVDSNGIEYAGKYDRSHIL